MIEAAIISRGFPLIVTCFFRFFFFFAVVKPRCSPSLRNDGTYWNGTDEHFHAFHVLPAISRTDQSSVSALVPYNSSVQTVIDKRFLVTRAKLTRRIVRPSKVNYKGVTQEFRRIVRLSELLLPGNSFLEARLRSVILVPFLQPIKSNRNRNQGRVGILWSFVIAYLQKCLRLPFFFVINIVPGFCGTREKLFVSCGERYFSVSLVLCSV